MRVVFDLIFNQRAATSANGLAYASTNGRVTSRTDAKGVSTSYGYDLLSRVLTTTDRTGKLTTNTYNPAGQLATIVDAQAKTTTYAYNQYRSMKR